MSRLALLAALGTLSSCLPTPPEPVFAVRRSALVPHPSPPIRTGHPISGVRASLRDSTLLVPIEPVETDGANAGLYVARHNVGFDLRTALSRSVDFGLHIDTALLRGAMPIAKDATRPPYGDHATGAGISLGASAPLTGPWRLGFAAELGFVSIPFFEEGRCIRNCGWELWYEESGHHEVWNTIFSVIPSYRDGPFTVYANVTFRNHATNTKSETQTDGQNMRDDASEIRRGPAYMIMGTGIEYATGALRVGAQVFLPATTSIADYGPALGITLGVEHDYSELIR